MMDQPLRGWEGGRWLKRRFSGLIGQRTAPAEVALGAAIGVFIAVLPLYGLHTVMVVIAAFLFKRANIIAMFAGTSISTVVTLPLLTWAGYAIGRGLLGPAYPPLSWSEFRVFDYQHLMQLYVPLFIGSLCLAAVLSLACYGLMLCALSMARNRRTMALAVFLLSLSVTATASPSGTDRRVIKYAISPAGRAEYREEGQAEVRGVVCNRVVFTSSAPGFRDVENIYFDPRSALPLKVERFVSFLFRKEHLVEEYDSVGNTLVIRKYIGSREVKSYRFSADGPFQNAVILPFLLRRTPDLAVGWQCVVRIPQEFTVTLAAVENIRVPAGKFTAYRFDSSPRRFQIWISADSEAIPLKIHGLGNLSLVLRAR